MIFDLKELSKDNWAVVLFNSGTKNFIKIDYHEKSNLSNNNREIVSTLQYEVNQMTSKLNPAFKVLIIFNVLMVIFFIWGIYMCFSNSQLELISIPIVCFLLCVISIVFYLIFFKSSQTWIEKLHEFYFRAFYPEHILLKNWKDYP